MFKPVKAKSISEYIALIKEPRKSQIIELDSIIQKTVPFLKPVFASNMLGYGIFHYKTKSGREGDWPVLSLASQKNYISVYVCSVTNGKYIAEEYKDKLGKVSVGKSCIRFKKIEDIDLEVFKKVLTEAAKSPGFE
ncbi:MAG: DUF1801 domain-containing protein [Candidatus Levybacteria bacterium]|nr:DUF1801 domain-containing protein [Candidatus Levybacteria bacterium]MBP9815176.1 DUF1801 domain-containing protein [Candidatus Levybacteria bacterium]